MNSTTTPTGNPERLAENAENIFANLESREQDFVKNNVFTFESYFATTPVLAIRAFSFPEGIILSENTQKWNEFITQCEEKYQNASSQNKDIFLEKFYEKMLDLTGSEPTPSMRTRSKMRRVMRKFFENPEN